VAVPDDMMGEKVGAVVVPVPGQPFDAGAVLAFARERLADFKVPQFLAVPAQPLPRNAAGKVRKEVLRERSDWVRA
jgi:acyl-CoA synthetase (AMP-forming)/AMP-acid ligase II